MITLNMMINRLMTLGMSEGRIAVEIGCKQPTVNRVKHGAETSYSTGKALERLYMKKFPDSSVCIDCKC